MKFVLALMFLSLNVQAAQEGGPLFAATTANQSPFQKLEEMFNGAGPAKLSDFPSYPEVKSGRSKPYRSIYMVSKDSSEMDLAVSTKRTVILTTANKTIPGAPSAGPLFPGTPDTIQNFQFLTYCSINETDDESCAIYSQNEQVLKAIEESQSKIEVSDQGVKHTLTYADVTFVIEYRKLGAYLLVKRTDLVKDVVPEVYYSYFWTE